MLKGNMLNAAAAPCPRLTGFGAAAGQPAFGAPATPGFGAPATPGFGAPATPAFGQSSGEAQLLRCIPLVLPVHAHNQQQAALRIHGETTL